MSGGAKLPSLAVGLAAVAAVSAVASLAGDGSAARSRSPALSDILGTGAEFKRGSIRGIVEARQRQGRRRTRVYISLHGLDQGARYRVAGVSRSCGVVDAADFVLWRKELRSGAAEDDEFRAARIRARGSLTRTRSIRVFEVTPAGELQQRACLGVDVWEHAYY